MVLHKSLELSSIHNLCGLNLRSSHFIQKPVVAIVSACYYDVNIRIYTSIYNCKTSFGCRVLDLDRVQT
jgi:hypothetical protein